MNEGLGLNTIEIEDAMRPPTKQECESFDRAFNRWARRRGVRLFTFRDRMNADIKEKESERKVICAWCHPGEQADSHTICSEHKQQLQRELTNHV